MESVLTGLPLVRARAELDHVQRDAPDARLAQRVEAGDVRAAAVHCAQHVGQLRVVVVLEVKVHGLVELEHGRVHLVRLPPGGEAEDPPQQLDYPVENLALLPTEVCGLSMHRDQHRDQQVANRTGLMRYPWMARLGYKRGRQTPGPTRT